MADVIVFNSAFENGSVVSKGITFLSRISLVGAILGVILLVMDFCDAAKRDFLP